MKKPFATAVLAFAVGMLGACGDSKPAPRSIPSKPAAKAAKPAAPTVPAEAKLPAGPTAITFVYAYNPLGKRDPFRSPDELRRAVEGPGNAPCHDPLCEWNLEQLKLRAVVTGDANPFAMLEDPQGAGHIVRRNTRVGRQGGRVTQILRDSIQVTEFFTQPDGKRAAMPREVTMERDKGFVPATDLASGKTFQ